MLVKVTIIIELISIFFCINKMYSKTLKSNILLPIIGVSLFIILDFINYWGINWLYTFIGIVVLFLYYLFKYKEGICKTTVIIAIGFLIQLIIQFVSAVIVGFFDMSNPVCHSFFASLISAVITFTVLPFCKLKEIKESIIRKHWLVYTIFTFICFFICIILLQTKMENGVRIGIYIFAIPALIIIVMLIINWNKSIMDEVRIRNERDLIIASQNNYDTLVETVKISNHGMKNHLSAIYATHYTCQNYEEMVEMQKQYYEKIIEESKHNKILLIENKTLSGFLYGKFKEFEEKEIIVEYDISTALKNVQLPSYYLIEMIGILIDNAVEAMGDEKRLLIYIKNGVDSYEFIIRNVYKKTTYSEMQQWFSKDISGKGKERGLGLYRVKKLCEEWQCGICCKNVMYDGKDWISFELTFK